MGKGRRTHIDQPKIYHRQPSPSFRLPCLAEFLEVHADLVRGLDVV